MEELRAYLKSLSPTEQARFAERCGTTLGYLRKALSKKPRLGELIVIALERESGGKVTCEGLRPDVDWAYLRSSRHSFRSTTRKAG